MFQRPSLLPPLLSGSGYTRLVSTSIHMRAIELLLFPDSVWSKYIQKQFLLVQFQMCTTHNTHSRYQRSGGLKTRRIDRSRIEAIYSAIAMTVEHVDEFRHNIVCIQVH